MTLIDIPSMAVIGGAAACAGISANFGRETLPRVSAIMIPMGLAGTTIGLVNMLRQMDDPNSIGPAIFVASLCFIYAAAAKLLIDRGLHSKTLPPPRKPNPVLRSLAGYFFIAIIIIASSYGGAMLSFVDIPALMLIGITLVALTFARGRYQKVGFLPASIRIIPIVGITSLFICNALIWLKLHDPTAIGPLMATGLLSCLYAMLYWVGVILVFPHRAQRNSNAAQWTLGGLSAFGLAACFTPVWLYFS